MNDTEKPSVQSLEEISKLNSRIAELERNLSEALAGKDALLLERETQFREIMERISDVIFEVDHKGVVAYFSPSGKDVWGYNREDVIGKNFIELVHPDDRDSLLQRFIELGNGVEKPLNYRLKDKAGNFRWVRTKTKPRIENGKFVGATGTLIDITDRKQVEETLKLHNAVLETVAEAIFLIGLEDNTIKWTNRKFDELFGYDPGEMVGMHVDKVNAPTEIMPSETRISIVDILKQTGKWTGEIKNIKKDGTSFWSYINVSLLDHPEFGQIMVSAHSDITKRKQAEKLLRENEDRLRTILKTAQDGFWLVDASTGRLVEVNEAAASMLGYTIGELLSRGLVDIDVQWSPEELYREMQKVKEGGNALFETRHCTKGGQTIHVEVSVNYLRANDQFFAFIHNITERKKAEEALKESEKKYRNIIDISPVPYALNDDEGNISFLNEAFTRSFGYTLEDIPTLADWWSKAYPDQDYQRQLAAAWEMRMEKARREGTALEPHEVTITCKNDLKRTAIVSAVGLTKSLEGTHLVILYDITERKLAEEELKNVLLFNKHIIDSAQDGIIVFDHELRYQLFNPFMEKLTGLKTSDVIGKTPSDLFPFLEESGVVGDLKKVLRGEKVEPREFQDQVPRSGRSGWVITTNAPLLNSKGEITGILAIVRDISEQKRTTEQLHHAQKMESVGRLAGGVAHDFNNMLGVILGYVEVAMDQVAPEHPLHANLLEIRNAANRSADLTRQLLAFARKQTITPKVLDLNETVEGMLKMLRRLIGEDIHLAWMPDTALWRVKIDPSQIDQILANLCVNARDAIAGVGKLTIETENITLDKAYCADHAGYVPGEYVLLAMSDNGCGMDKEILGNLFEPFFTTKGVGKGTGLGLATIYGIVKQNNGFINVYSEPDQGTTFKIYLPRHVGKSGRAQKRESREPVMRGHETVLVVEDEPSLLELSKLMLETQGYRVLPAGTPGEAMRLAEEHAGEIHLLMTDVVMPEMNGPDLAQRLLSLYPNLKCMFTSGYTADVITHHGVLDEGVYFIQKPFSRKNLAAKVREALGQE